MSHGGARRCRQCGKWIDSWKNVSDGEDSTMSVCHKCYAALPLERRLYQ